MFAVLFLMLTESFCEDLRTAKYYYCTTLFVYESMFIMSVLLMTLHQKTPYHTKFSIFMEISFFLTTKLFFCSHWIKKHDYPHLIVPLGNFRSKKTRKVNTIQMLNGPFSTHRGNQKKISLI